MNFDHTILSAARSVITPPATRRSEYRALALMYVTQGLPTGFAFYALGTLIRDSGYSVAAIGWVSLAILPWALKFLWASAIDNACTRWGYPQLILSSQILAVLTCLALIAFPLATHLGGALAGIVLLNTICATQDIATNAYAISRMQGKAAGPANGLQVSGFLVGMLLGGGGLLIVHAAWGWRAAMSALAGLMALSGLMLWLDRRWQEPVLSTFTRSKVRLRDLLHHADLGWALTIALLFKFPGTAVSTLMQPWLVDRGLTLDAIGKLHMVIILTTALGGLGLGIPLVRYLGSRRAVVLSCVMVAVVLGTAFGMETFNIHALWAYYLAFCVQAAFEGAMFVAIWALFMNWSSPQSPGTDFTAMQCSESMANGMAAAAIGGLGQALGYANAFALAWAFMGIAACVIALCLARLSLVQQA